MKLQPDLVRHLLLWAEENLPIASGKLSFPVIEGYSEEEVAYHCLQAAEAGFIDTIDYQTFQHSFQQRIPRRLTYEGHKYLEQIRDEKIWAQAKEGAKKLGSFGLDTLGKLAVGFIETEIKKRTGYELGD
jgi:hypothetical protein